MNIVLVGFMGSGKTSAGRLLAEKTGREFVDVDSVIENEQKMKVSEIFSRFGEERFRQMESGLVERLSLRDGLVISTGGGIVLNSGNVANLKKNGVLIWLMVTCKEAGKRTRSDSCRPLLKVREPEKTIRKLMEQRNPLYAQSDYRVDTSGRPVEEVVEEIIKLTGGLEQNG